MIVETALALAGSGSVLAARPTGVAHVVAPGPLTPGGGFIPRARRPVCRARTRRLTVLDLPARWSSLHPTSALPRLCARCSARLDRSRGNPRPGTGAPTCRAEHRPLITVNDYRAAHADTTDADLHFAALCAETPDELTAVAHASLVVLGHRGCTRPVSLPGGRIGKPLHQLLTTLRRLIDPDPQTTEYFAALDDRVDQAKQARIADLAAARQARDEATPAPRDIPNRARSTATGAPL